MDSQCISLGEEHVDSSLPQVGEKRSRAMSEASGHSNGDTGAVLTDIRCTIQNDKTENCCADEVEVSIEDATGAVTGDEVPLQPGSNDATPVSLPSETELEQEVLEVVEISDLTAPEVSHKEVHTGTEAALLQEESALEEESPCAAESHTITDRTTAVATVPEQKDGEEAEEEEGNEGSLPLDDSTENGETGSGEQEGKTMRISQMDEELSEAPEAVTTAITAAEHEKTAADDASAATLTKASSPHAFFEKDRANSCSQLGTQTQSRTAEVEKSEDEDATAAAAANPTVGTSNYVHRSTTGEASTNISEVSEAGTPPPPPSLLDDVEDEKASLSKRSANSTFASQGGSALCDRDEPVHA
ncbi:hypothetical protein ABL78_5224 [Leptomonas seymouri]|uniref:Uncharacterized protein n=1 Tax=Leptomonas seymouri TaxID=5684 RepID=A0A0N0P594_LEPSE|nr:hypothetical protein ABL78_5224 [Leptomonas seymouri]|eukprot:KPI85737.1 hypothetical protein ABL78_5224 [Leptomonas seymouri]